MVLVLFVSLVFPDFKALGPMTFKHCYLYVEEGRILSLQKGLKSLDDVIIRPKTLTTEVGFQSGKQVEVRWSQV